MVNALCADGEIGHPVIGITCYAVSVTADEGIGADGLYVATIFSNSDAAIQGLQVGDIITAIDGQPIRQVSDVDLASRHVGDVITATVWRDGETLQVGVTLIDRAGREELPLLSKAETAEKIADKIESILK